MDISLSQTIIIDMCGLGNSRGASGTNFWPYRDPLDLVESNVISGPIIEFCGVGAFMRGHGLRVFQRTAVFEIRRDPGRPKCMATDPNACAEIGRATLNHAPGVHAA